MKKTVVGNYTNTTDAMERVNNLISEGYPADSISVIASQADAYTLRDNGITVESGFEYVDGANDESLWQRIKAFFSGEDTKLHEKSLDEYRDSIRNGNVLVLVDNDLVPETLYADMDTEEDGCDCGVMEDTVAGYADDTYAAVQQLENLGDETLRLREEQMDVNKREVEAGEAIIHKRVVEETRTIDVPVRHEEIVIERRNVANGEVDGADFKDETITIPLMEEQVEVSKHAVVTQEVNIHKREVENVEQVSASLRKEELDVDQEGNTIIVDNAKVQ